MKTPTQILHLLKREGRLTAKTLAEHLDMTAMGARQHLSALANKELVSFEDVKVKVGRPHRYWFLTSQGHQYFVDRHSDLTIDVLNAVEESFGSQGLEILTAKREQKLLKHYQDELGFDTSWQKRLEKFAKLRDLEGYMAEIETHPQGLLFIENHCTIHQAAKHCALFCQSELNILQTLFENECRIERIEHIQQKQRRCAYLIQPKS